MASFLRRIAMRTMPEVVPVRAKVGRTRIGPAIIVPKEFVYQDTVDLSDLPLESDPTTGWTQSSRRVGVLAQKVGMCSQFSEWLEFMPMTILRVPQCHVTQVKEKSVHGFTALQIGCGERKAKNLSKALLEHLQKAGVGPKAKLAEFRVTDDAVVPVGSEISVRHFVPGQYLDIQGVAQGKGFAGGMKRWGFAGLAATHGVSVSHRSIGSTGQNQTPGKVWKGKKMPGRMGGKHCTMKNLFLWKIDVENGLLYVRGCVPGAKQSWLRVRDAKNKLFHVPPPFPYFVAPADEVEPPKEIIAHTRRPSEYVKGFSEAFREKLRSGPNYANMAPLREESAKEKAYKGYEFPKFSEGD